MLARRTLQSSVRLFSTSRVALTEGAISQGKDSFAEKERAQENLYIRKHEAEQLKALKKQLDEQKKLVDDLKNEVDKLKKLPSCNLWMEMRPSSSHVDIIFFIIEYLVSPSTCTSSLHPLAFLAILHVSCSVLFCSVTCLFHTALFCPASTSWSVSYALLSHYLLTTSAQNLFSDDLYTSIHCNCLEHVPLIPTIGLFVGGQRRMRTWSKGEICLVPNRAA